MTEKKPKEKIYALTVRMSRENLYRLKERALQSRMKMRDFIHQALGLKIEEEKK